MATGSRKIEGLLLNRRMDTRQQLINEAKEALVGRYAPMLVLGAGVSVPAKLPGWKKLVSALFGYGLVSVRHNTERYFKRELEPNFIPRETELIAALINGDVSILDSSNVLETGQYIEEMLGNAYTESWVRNEELKEALGLIIDKGVSAKDAKEKLEHGDSAADPKKLPVNRKCWPRENTLLAVAYILSSNTVFHQAITYNYDTYVEEYMQEIYSSGNEVITHIDGWNQYRSSKTFTEIFHVHGCVPTKYFREKSPLEPGDPRESKTIILSEDSYYGVEDGETYNWMNSVQSEALNRSTCIFVGFSGEDYNFRRILRQLGRGQRGSRPKHYMLVTIEDSYKKIHDECKKQWGSEAEEYARILLDRVLMAKEDYWGRFGFYPIWVTVEDIPEILLSLAHAGGAD